MMPRYQLTVIMVFSLSTLCFAQGRTSEFAFKLGKTNYFINLSKGNTSSQNDTAFYNLYREGKTKRIAKEIKSIVSRNTGDTLKSGYYVVLEKTVSFFQISKDAPAYQRVYTQNPNGLLSLKNGILNVDPPKLPIEPVLPTTANTNHDEKVDIPAEFPGGIIRAREFIARQLRYPKEAQKNEVGGTVRVKFMIGADGVISNIELLNKLGYGLDDEIIRVVKLMPKWVPAKRNGKPVSSYFIMPISFHLN